MAANARFAFAAHILAAIAQAPAGKALSSVYLASSVNTHPVVVRRIMADLVSAGLVRASAGKKGGFRLGRPAADISLWDIMKAVDGCTVFGFNPNPVNPRCPVSVAMGQALQPVLGRAQRAVELSLSQTKVCDLLGATSPPANQS